MPEKAAFPVLAPSVLALLSSVDPAVVEFGASRRVALEPALAPVTVGGAEPTSEENHRHEALLDELDELEDTLAVAEDKLVLARAAAATDAAGTAHAVEASPAANSKAATAALIAVAHAARVKALQLAKHLAIADLLERVRADLSAAKAKRRGNHLLAERIAAHRRLWGPGFVYTADQDGEHFRVSELCPPDRAQTVASAAPTMPQAAAGRRGHNEPVINWARPKGQKSERSVRFVEYTARPRPAGRPQPRAGADGNSAENVRVERKLDKAERRARVAAMHRATFPEVMKTSKAAKEAATAVGAPKIAVTVAAAAVDAQVAAPSPPKHFFADWLVEGVDGRVRMCLDSGSDVSTVEVAHLSDDVLCGLEPLPGGLTARAFDGTTADMSNFMGTVQLVITLGAFKTTALFYVVKRGMAPFVLSKFVQAEMGAVLDYKTWQYRPADRTRLSKEAFDVVLAADVVVSGPVAVRCRVLLPESMLQGGVADLHVDAETDLVGVVSAESGTDGIAAECVPVVVANSVSRAQLLKTEPAVLLKTGGGRTRRMRWCAIAVNILCNNGRAALTAGQYVANAQQTRSNTTFYRMEHAILADDSRLPTLPTLASTTVFDDAGARTAVADDLLHDESTVWYDDDPVPTTVAIERIEAKIAETLADLANGCKGLADHESAIRACLGQMHLGPDEDGKIGGAALGVEHLVDGPERFRPVTRRNYQYSHEEIVFIEETITKLLAQGVIEKAATPWVSPIVVATHPRTGKLRFCVDYRGVNALTIPDAYSLPRIKQVFEAVNGMDVLSIVDVAQAFPHVPMAADSRQYTGFRGPRNDLYQYVGSPFGLMSLPATWQRYMEAMFSGMLWQSVCIYVDDILVFSKDVESHVALLSDVFRVLREHNLALRVEKCHFFKREVEYLGFLLSGEGVRAVPASVEKILACPAPTTKGEIRRFMGMAEQYRAFIPDFAATAKPLSRQQGKAKKGGQTIRFQWGKEEDAAFEALKVALSTTPVLTLPDLSRPFRIYIDASEFAMGAILCQLDAEQKERVIGYYSKMMNPAQINYTVSEKECLAVHHFITTLRHFFAGGGPHELFTDHAALTALTKGELHNRRMIRWATELATFNFVIKHIPGSTMPADALTKGPAVRASAEVMALANKVSPLGTAWRLQTGTEPVVAAVSWSSQKPGSTTLISKLNLGGQSLLELQSADARIASWLQFIRDGRPRVDVGATKEARRARKLLEEQTRGMLIDTRGYLVRYAGRSTGGRTLFVTPVAMVESLLVGAHRGTVVGAHAGVGGEGMRRILSESYYWPELQKDCITFVPSGRCETCLAANRAPGKPAGLLHHLSVGRPFQFMAMDCVPMPADADGFCQMCVFVCSTTRFPIIVPLKDAFSTTLAKAYLEHVLPYTGGAGTQELWADVGSNQASVLMRDFTAALGIESRFAFPGRQQANAAELSVKRVKEIIRRTLLHVPTDAWRGALSAIFLQLISTEGRTGVSPYEAVYGRKPKSQMDLVLCAEHGPLPQREAHRSLAEHIAHIERIQAHVRAAVELAREEDEPAYNRGHVDAQLREGDYVLVKEKIAAKDHNLAPTFGLDVFKVIEIHSDMSILVRRCTSQGAKGGSTKRTMLVSIADLRKLACDDDPSESRIARVHDHNDVADGRQYLVEFPGLGDKRQFQWTKESELLTTAGNDESLVAYDMLRNAERRVAFVPDRFNEEAEPDIVAVAEPVKRKAGRPKKSVVVAAPAPVPAAVVVPPSAEVPEPDVAVPAMEPQLAPAVAERSQRQRKSSLKAREMTGGGGNAGAKKN